MCVLVVFWRLNLRGGKRKSLLYWIGSKIMNTQWMRSRAQIKIVKGDFDVCQEATPAFGICFQGRRKFISFTFALCLNTDYGSTRRDWWYKQESLMRIHKIRGLRKGGKSFKSSIMSTRNSCQALPNVRMLLIRQPIASYNHTYLPSRLRWSCRPWRCRKLPSLHFDGLASGKIVPSGRFYGIISSWVRLRTRDLANNNK